MKNFKLIAIRPLSDCNKKFTKILKEGVIYSFYNEYDFSKYTDRNKTVSKKGVKPPDIFSIKNIGINISAIVGENGSGKSTIVELFYVSCYNISAIKDVLFDENEKRQLNFEDIVPEINVEIFYEVDEETLLLQLKGSNINLFKLENNIFKPSKNKKLDLNDFFYTVSINYSLHSLNSNILGDWINRIFHKNDGYRTPIVLNPFRINGNIEINNEEYLVRSRLLTNILGKINGKLKVENSLRNIIDKKVAHKLRVKLKKEKFIYNEDEKPIFQQIPSLSSEVLPIVYKYFLKNEAFVPKDTVLNQYAQKYILYKLESIANKYDPYIRLFRYWFESKNKTDDFIRMLSEEKSHITFKLTQAVNFLANELYYNRKETFELTISYLSKQLTKYKDSKEKELIEILPPAFFDIDIEFKNSDLFSALSSGEKQRVYSIATLIYHLTNLSSTNKKFAVVKYERVNVIFDELELYFHPELQRNLINDIIENIKKIDLKEITAINILLITHSPFILSDIPDSNILFLTDGGIPIAMEDELKTFGGNIHELLRNSFFLKNGTIGEFAKNKIQSIITSLNNNEQPNTNKHILEEIQIIGEPFLKRKLLEMYYSKFDTQKRIEELKAEIQKLEDNDQIKYK